MRDLLPAQTTVWQRLERGLCSVAEGFGYQEIRLPLLEKTELFARTAGDTSDIVEKQMYTLGDTDGAGSMALRPEGTAGCVRACIQEGLLSQPQRLWYRGPMFRHERPQKGRYRQFEQIGVEALGFAGADLDAELIMLMSEVWQALELDSVVQLELNTIGDSDDRARFRAALIEYLTPYQSDLDEDSQRRLHLNPLRILDSKAPATQRVLDEAPKLADCLGRDALAHHDRLLQLLSDLGISYVANERLVRGLDYYNRSVFEWTTDLLGAQSAVCAGGRYDTLVPLLGGPEVPAAGFALGLDRTALLLEQTQTAAESALDAYCVVADDSLAALALQWSQKLRHAVPGLRVRVHMGGGKMKAQFKKADASTAAVALVLGADEAATNTLTVKPLRDESPQLRLDAEQLVEWLNRNLPQRGDRVPSSLG